MVIMFESIPHLEHSPLTSLVLTMTLVAADRAVSSAAGGMVQARASRKPRPMSKFRVSVQIGSKSMTSWSDLAGRVYKNKGRKRKGGVMFSTRKKK